MDIITKFLKL